MIRLVRFRVLISSALAGEYVQLEPEGARWPVAFGPISTRMARRPAARMLFSTGRLRGNNFAEASGASWR